MILQKIPVLMIVKKKSIRQIKSRRNSKVKRSFKFALWLKKQIIHDYILKIIRLLFRTFRTNKQNYATRKVQLHVLVVRIKLNKVSTWFLFVCKSKCYQFHIPYLLFHIIQLYCQCLNITNIASVWILQIELIFLSFIHIK